MLVLGNALNIPLANQSVQMVCTSPPYWGLRNYNVDGQLGLEKVPDCLGWATGAACGECYVCQMVKVFREVKRVLRDDGCVFLNLGDSYAADRGYQVPDNKHKDVGNNHGAKVPAGLKAKDLVGIPWRVAFALQDAGWYLRSDIIWSKPNPMPESVTDRPTKSHEYLFLLAKQERYYYDADAVREPAQEWTGQAATFERESGKATELRIPGQTHASHRASRNGGDFSRKYAEQQPSHGAMRLDRPPLSPTRNRRSVWSVATVSYDGAHFATFPPALIEPCILAGCPAGGIVLDPFAGSGTTGQVARLHGRRFVGLDLNATYLRDLALPRAEGKQTAASLATLPLFAAVTP